MTKYRKAAKVDENQPAIVAYLRSMPGVMVEVNHDDILVGFRGRTFWYEIKTPDAVSKRTGLINESEKKDSQKRLEREWTGHYKIVYCITQIIDDLLTQTRERRGKKK